MELITMVYVLYGLLLLSVSLNVITFIWTPALAFLGARLGKNKGVAVVSGKSPLVRFVTAKNLGGQWKTKTHGVYDESDNSVYFAHKTPVVFVNEYQAATLPGKFLRGLHALRKIVGIKNFKDYKEQIAVNEGKAVKMPAETIQINHLAHMFPFINDPHIRQKETSAEVIVTDALSTDKSKNLRTWLVILLIGGIVAFIIWSLFKGGGNTAPVEVICRYPDQILNGVQSTGGNLTI